MKGGFWVEGCLARKEGRTAGRREAISQEGLRGYSCLKGCVWWLVVSWCLIGVKDGFGDPIMTYTEAGDQDVDLFFVVSISRTHGYR